MMEQMTLDELKTGMHVVLRSGKEGIVFRGGNFEDMIAILNNGTHSLLSNHFEDMRSIYACCKDCDIVKVYDVDPTKTGYMFECVNGKEEDGIDGIELIYVEEEPITRAEAEKLLGRRIVD